VALVMTGCDEVPILQQALAAARPYNRCRRPTSRLCWGEPTLRYDDPAPGYLTHRPDDYQVGDCMSGTWRSARVPLAPFRATTFTASSCRRISVIAVSSARGQSSHRTGAPLAVLSALYDFAAPCCVVTRPV